jgi:hypothetical protein
MTPTIVRELCCVSYHYYREHGDSGVEELVKETDARALATATREGIASPSITRMWSPRFGPLGYPMHLLGPGAPKIDTCRDALVYSEVAEYQIIIREADQS